MERVDTTVAEPIESSCSRPPRTGTARSFEALFERVESVADFVVPFASGDRQQRQQMCPSPAPPAGTLEPHQRCAPTGSIASMIARLDASSMRATTSSRVRPG